MLHIGHRGAKGIIRENTLPSIEYAIKSGVDAVEVDVHKCATGELVVFHNHSLTRWKRKSTRIEDLTITQIKSKKLKGRHSIPTLHEVIEAVGERVLLNIELKGEGTAKPVLELLKKGFKDENWHPDHYLISSFSERELRMFRELDNEIKLGVLYTKKWKLAFELAKELKAYSMHPYYKFLKPYQVEKMKEEGFKIFTYTVNKNRHIERMRKLGVDGMFCDYPKRNLKDLK